MKRNIFIRVECVYVLHYSAIVQDFGKGDASRKEVAKQAWLGIKSKLLKTFQEFGRKNSYGLFGNSGYFKSGKLKIKFYMYTI